LQEPLFEKPLHQNKSEQLKIFRLLTPTFNSLTIMSCMFSRSYVDPDTDSLEAQHGPCERIDKYHWNSTWWFSNENVCTFIEGSDADFTALCLLDVQSGAEFNEYISTKQLDCFLRLRPTEQLSVQLLEYVQSLSRQTFEVCPHYGEITTKLSALTDIVTEQYQYNTTVLKMMQIHTTFTTFVDARVFCGQGDGNQLLNALLEANASTNSLQDLFCQVKQRRELREAHDLFTWCIRAAEQHA
jgi:hypothetical protein